MESIFHGASREDAKHAKFGEYKKIFFFAPLAQPEADPSQPKADPSSGGLWRSLGAINFVEVVLLNISKGRI